MQLERLWLVDFRSHPTLELELAAGVTAILGRNGAGKTNILEAIGYLAHLSSFRGAPNEALVRHGAERAVVRGRARRAGRELLVEIEIPVKGRARAQLNRQPVARTRDLTEVLAVTVFTPDDLDLVKRGPAERRRLLDDGIVGIDPRQDRLRSELDRILRQRNALLRQAGGRLALDIGHTLDVWDDKLATVGEAWAEHRRALTERLQPLVAARYGSMAAGGRGRVEIDYQPEWLPDGLAPVLAAGRANDVRRGVTLVGPHRDELDITIDGLAARSHASQGEQRSLAIALRLGVHQLMTEALGAAPILLLDDVFSELDDHRSAALLDVVPLGQTIITSATELPPGARAQAAYRLGDRGVQPVTSPE